MRTPWGDLVVCDAHIHFFSDRFFRLLAAQKPGLVVADAAGEITARLGWERPEEDAALFGLRWAQELDRRHVARASILASLPGDEDSVLEAAAAVDGRFYPYFFLNPLARDAGVRAAQALDRGAKTVCLLPAMHRYSMHDPYVRGILELVAARPGKAVFVHCGVLTVGIRNKLDLPSHFDLRFSNPLDLHALALQFPRVPFIVPHFGAGYFREALMLCDLCPNVYLDTSSSNRWMRYEGLTLPQVFRRALDVAGPSRLLFGTDSSYFPRGWHAAVFEQQVAALREVGIDAQAAAQIFGGNLERLYG